MGALLCICNGHDPYTKLLSSFFNELPLRSTSGVLYNEVSVECVDKKNLSNEEAFMRKIVDRFLIHPSHQKISREIFLDIQRKYSTELPLVLLALVFLTEQEKESMTVTFRKMASYYMRDSTKRELNKYFITKGQLIEILRTLADIVSYTAVQHLDSISSNREDFKQVLSLEYDEKYQTRMVEHHLGEFVGLFVDINEFFDKKFQIFSKDDVIRAEISHVYSTYKTSDGSTPN